MTKEEKEIALLVLEIIIEQEGWCTNEHQSFQWSRQGKLHLSKKMKSEFDKRKKVR